MRATVLVTLLLPAVALANPFPQGDVKAGEKLTAERKCESCHVDLMGGDGSGIYTRANRRVKSPQDLVQRVAACSSQTNAGWFPEEEAHVAAYLNSKFYKFK